MKGAKAKLYIRFGDIPEDQLSKVHRGDQEVRSEGGISVWKAIESNCKYFPLLPKHPNDNTIADYFKHLLYDDGKVYLVTGDELFLEGADREPLLMNVKVIKDITSYYRNADRKE